jgi:hypothetical protein
MSGFAIHKTLVCPSAALGEKALELVGIHLPVMGLCINEYGPRTNVPYRIGRRHEAERGDNYFVFRQDAGHA